MRSLSALALGLGVLAVPSGARQARPEGPAQAPPRGPVVRISLEVVQVDAVVTDGDGRFVTDLEAKDFEILEDGKPQPVTLCSYVRTGDEAAAASPVPAAPTGSLRRESVRRTLAFVVDDLSLGFESTVRVRHLLTKFVDEQMQAGDLVAIVRTGAGLGSLQQFTSDRRLLKNAIDRIRYNLAGRGPLLSAFALGPQTSAPGAAAGGPGGAAMAAFEQRVAGFDRRTVQARQALLATGTLGALRYVMSGLATLPGRKSVTMLSEGFALYEEGRTASERDFSGVHDAIRSVTEEANRASVVLYAIDPRGLLTLRPDASGSGGSSLQDLLEQRAGLAALADETGGLLFADTNDLAGTLERVLEEQKGYYLIGYAPSAESFELETGRPRYHRLSVRVKRPELRVRSRKGFYGAASPEPEDVPGEPAGLLAALGSPFSATDLAVRLTCLFGREEKLGSHLRSLVHIDAAGLTLAEEPDGAARTTLEMVVMAFGANGRVVGQVAREHRVRVEPAYVNAARRGGIVHIADMPLDKAGGYQLRVAVRDVASGRLGSASQFVEVPDLRKDRLALSGIVMSAEHRSENAEEGDPNSTPAVRRFRRGARVSYAFFVYNPRVPRAPATPQVETRVSLLNEGREIVALPPRVVDPGGLVDTRRLAAGGDVLMAPALAAGSYTLQVVATDKLRKGSSAVALQWMDFEVLE